MNQSTDAVKPIPTEYAGHQFRSRLEARWAVFFDEMGIPWQYEPEGYQLPSGWYVPDFYLPQCATFCEVRGDIARVDLAHLGTIATELPKLTPTKSERGPSLMLLGPMPTVVPSMGDLGWLSFYRDEATMARYGFGTYHKNNRPWWFDNQYDEHPLQPTHNQYEWPDALSCYRHAAATRFWNPR